MIVVSIFSMSQSNLFLASTTHLSSRDMNGLSLATAGNRGQPPKKKGGTLVDSAL
jgi:hypothetical protein